MPLRYPATGLTSGLGVGRSPTQGDPHSLNRRERISRQCPLPPGASSIDLKDSQSFVQPDHATSVFRLRRSCLLAPWAPRSLHLLYTRHGSRSQVRSFLGAAGELLLGLVARGRLRSSRIWRGTVRTSGHHVS